MGYVVAKHAGNGNGEPVRFAAKPIAAENDPVEEVGVDPNGTAPVGVRVDDGLVVVFGGRFWRGCESHKGSASRPDSACGAGSSGEPRGEGAGRR